ncbi:hypothetical protein [Kribbella sp. NPDC051620]|uniref:hypothetical protein n=1 Tax=Kribbella sp. NPDC051620 TaxID=3364120 RepID=UPI0037997265
MKSKTGNSNPESSRLRGSLLRIANAEQATERALPTSLEHSPTWDLEFSTGPTSVGDLELDGYQAWNSNHSSGQDAFAISGDRTRFAVADGMGGYGTDKIGTQFFAKFISDHVVQNGIDSVFDLGRLEEICQRAEDEFSKVAGRPFQRPRMIGKMVGTVGSTLTFAEVLSPTQVRLVTIGDSPAFVVDGTQTHMAQYGEDAQLGTVDSPLAYKLGIDGSGRAISPQERATSTLDARMIVDQVLDIPLDSTVIIGSDYFSETSPLEILRDPPRTGYEFQDRVVGRGKPDDATLIAIRPSKLTL